MPPDAAQEIDVVISLMYRATEDLPEAGLYPINALRNLALSHARTELVFLLDVDFVPSQGLLRDLLHEDEEPFHGGEGATSGDTPKMSMLQRLRTSRTALVLPAFEVMPKHRLPKQQASLTSLLTGCSPPGATPFHCAHFAAGHAPTDFALATEFWGQQLASADGYNQRWVALNWRMPDDARSDAVAYYRKALALKPSQHEALCELVHTNEFIADWSERDQGLAMLEATLDAHLA